MPLERKASAAIVIAALAAAFWAGSEMQKAAYLDQCLDLGGGQNPGNHPICVIEQASPSLQLGPVVIAAQGLSAVKFVEIRMASRSSN